ncbi:MAG: hypothetical protein U9N36_09685, partial [Euryarchaeota archaeon]|nr:hypothetical protein [Euryarchaeota archaeon]
EFSPPIGVEIIEPEIELPNQVSMEDAKNNVNFTILNPSYTAGMNSMVQLFLNPDLWRAFP